MDSGQRTVFETHRYHWNVIGVRTHCQHQINIRNVVRLSTGVGDRNRVNGTKKHNHKYGKHSTECLFTNSFIFDAACITKTTWYSMHGVAVDSSCEQYSHKYHIDDNKDRVTIPLTTLSFEKKLSMWSYERVLSKSSGSLLKDIMEVAFKYTVCTQCDT